MGGRAPSRRSSGLNRERIVAAAVELADSDGLAALSMARLAERLGCGTMSLYRHVANKDELVTFMLAVGAEDADEEEQLGRTRTRMSAKKTIPTSGTKV